MDGQVSTFDVAVTREDGYWVGVVDGLRGGATESRTLAGLEAELVDLIQGLLDLEEGQVKLNIQMEAGLNLVVERLIEAQDAMQRAKDEYEARQIHAVHVLAEQHVSARDSARLMGISHQRVSQLLNS